MSLPETDYDIIVAGGGLAGMIVASSAAYFSNETLRILVVDRNPLSLVGKKTMTGWICGDAVGKKKCGLYVKANRHKLGVPGN
jgi:succinate dehydrogenase/fumarate reductase flavoprotein subunit